MYQQVVRSCGVVYFSLVNTVNDHFSGVAIAFHDLNGFFIDAISHEILSKGTVVAIGHLGLLLLGVTLLLFGALIVYIFYIDVVDVA